MLLKISQNSEENTCVGVSILINLHTSALQLYQKKETSTQLFSCEFCEFLRTPFFQNTSEQLLLKIKLLKTKFLIHAFTYFEISLTNHIA